MSGLILQLLIAGVRDVYSLRYSELASSTIIVFDHLITLDDEIELIWKSSWSIGKVLFIINRYYTLASVIANNYVLFGPSFSESSAMYRTRLLLRLRILWMVMGTGANCFLYSFSSPLSLSMFPQLSSLRFFRWQGVTGLFAAMIAEIILQMRLYALYFLDKKILHMMVATFVATSAASATIMGVVLSQMKASMVFLPSIGPFCVPSNIPNYFYTFWIPILTFETLLCTMAVTKGIQTFRTSGSLFRSGRQLVGILIRDSIVYFFVMFATYLTCLLVWLIGSINMLEIPIGFSVAMSCVLGNRVILNVRSANRDIAELESRLAASRNPDQLQLSEAPTWKQQTASKHSNKQGASVRIFSRSDHSKEDLEDDHIDTLTDMEMAQLRSMRADTPPDHEGFIVV